MSPWVRVVIETVCIITPLLALFYMRAVALGKSASRLGRKELGCTLWEKMEEKLLQEPIRRFMKGLDADEEEK